MSRIPGFRSNKTWKKIIATFGYLMIFGVIATAVNGGGSNKTSPVISPVQQEQQKNADAKQNDITKELTQTPSVTAPISQPETTPSVTPVPPATDPVVKTDPIPNQTNQDITVYITRTGKKYHRDGCRSLAKSKSSISLSDAKAEGYTPCSICKPPQ